MRNYLAFIFGLIFLLTSCGTAKQASNVASPSEDSDEIVVMDNTGIITEERFLDTMDVVAPRELDVPEINFELPKYNGSHLRRNDLLHTTLKLKFNWEKEQVIGQAQLKLQPYFYPMARVTLDAKNFQFHKVAYVGSKDTLAYQYDGATITIDLGKIYRKGETYELMIDYTASPAATGGSAAIQSDQGLFFINPRGEEPGKPQQIWTQGETEWNSRWFPTIDKPNERCTQEMFITVQDEFKTLSNGLLKGSVKNDDGTRTDHWQMDLPHAPYLFMLAVGDFAVVKDEWENIPVEYYVEPKYEKSARAIFSNTVEMLDFFSEKLDLKYPWPKYSQIVVRDYVSGAMENTTGVIYGEFVQKHERELIDNHNERILAHELFHHWFGDYVTCESWANLTMNEGFANYSEYLWFEHKYGVDEADYHLLTEWGGYISSAQSNAHPLIYHAHDDKEDMFDAHSYNKGGAVLHMLRKQVGDEAFWAALNLYLRDNAYQSVEVHDLRLAFEEVTGQDLNWFFDQWYLEQGHPVLNITYGYDEARKKATIKVEQQQDPVTMFQVFQLPVDIDIYLEDGQQPIKNNVFVNQRIQTFEFEVPSKPKLINFDSEKMLLAEINTNKTEAEFLFQFRNAKKFLDRYEALQGLSGSEALKNIAKEVIKDNFWVIRGLGLQSLGEELDAETIDYIRRLATEDPHSQIRALSLGKLSQIGDKSIVDLSKKIIDSDQSYTVIATALDVLIEKDRAVALEYATKLEDVDSEQLIEVIGALYTESGEAKYLPFFEKNLNNIDGFMALSFYESYQALATKGDYKTASSAVEKLKEIAVNDGQSIMKRLAAAKSVNDIRNFYRTQANESEDEAAKNAFEKHVEELNEIMEQIKEQETNTQLKQIYDSRLLLLDKV